MVDCDICKRNVTHGGNCYMKKNNCLLFEEDERGQIKYTDIRLKIEFDSHRKAVKENDEIKIDGNVTETATIKIIRIKQTEWSYGKHGIDGMLLKVKVTYYDKEYNPELNINKKSKFRILQGGKF